MTEIKVAMEKLEEEIRRLEEEVDMILFRAEEEGERELTDMEVADIHRLERICEGLVDEWRSMRG